MSTEYDKLKHSKRIHADETAIKKQMKIAKSHGIEVKEPQFVPTGLSSTPVAPEFPNIENNTAKIFPP